MMGSPLELKPLLLRPFGDQSDDHQKLQELVARLEEERLKIDAFKRELPLCMQLLTNAMEASRQQLQTYKDLVAQPRPPPPVLEEFIPLKNKSSSSHDDDDDVGEKDTIKKPNMAPDNKANWMTSAQLWSHHHQTNNNNNNKSKSEGSKQLDVVVYSSLKEGDDDDDDSIGFSMMTPKAAVSETAAVGGGALLTFPNPTTLALGASLSARDRKGDDQADNVDAVSCISQRDGRTAAAAAVAANNNSNSSTTTATQTQRKARRCWSPDLHRRFVNALHILGGSQVATPKQIRELMKVDGLTNDEVKSHLQKYRLHTRRPIPSPQTAAPGAPQLVVLGGIWVPSEYTAAATHNGVPPSVAAATSLYGAHPAVHAPQQHHYCPSPASQVVHHELYAPQHRAGAALHHLHHQQQPVLHHPLHAYKPPPSYAQTTQSSPASGYRSESIEDGKSSESGGSWKGDSGSDNGGKAVLLREGGEMGKNNGMEISLKF
ncbi:unnamed protein product [Cuscuta campestris]|uniref:HTH myb-type domain-containing protein n=1 Tax=Cuscuta campestris TaxID=132261 RepID=A0A484NDZ3_9ASTE|nr:unnamed protein product [Cuscuta campestris]